MRALISRIAEATKKTGIEKFRIDWKRNAKGELVVAIIVAPDEPHFGADAIEG